MPADCRWQPVVNIRLIWHGETWISTAIIAAISKGSYKENPLLKETNF
jgi:hypothetical protein